MLGEEVCLKGLMFSEGSCFRMLKRLRQWVSSSSNDCSEGFSDEVSDRAAIES